METLIYVLIGIAIVCCVCNTMMCTSLYFKLKDVLDCDEDLDDYDKLSKKVDALFTLIESNTKSILVSIESQNETDKICGTVTEKTNDVIDAIGNAVYNIKSQLPKRRTKKDTTSEK